MSKSERIKNIHKPKQDPIDAKDLQKFFTYVLTNYVGSKEDAEKINELARRTVTLSDVVVAIKTITQQEQTHLEQVMEMVELQYRVLEKLGATKDMFSEARKDYDKALEDMEKKMKEEHESSQPQVKGDAPDGKEK